MTDLYDFPEDFVGRRTYVSVRGHTRSIPRFKTYRGADGYNRLLPEYGGTDDHFGDASAYYMPDKAPYLSPLDGSYITSRSQHREHMNKHGVVEAGDMPLPTGQRNRDVHAPVTGRDIADVIRQLGGH